MQPPRPKLDPQGLGPAGEAAPSPSPPPQRPHSLLLALLQQLPGQGSLPLHVEADSLLVLPQLVALLL